MSSISLNVSLICLWSNWLQNLVKETTENLTEEKSEPVSRSSQTSIGESVSQTEWVRAQPLFKQNQPSADQLGDQKQSRLLIYIRENQLSQLRDQTRPRLLVDASVINQSTKIRLCYFPRQWVVPVAYVKASRDDPAHEQPNNKCSNTFTSHHRHTRIYQLEIRAQRHQSSYR